MDVGFTEPMVTMPIPILIYYIYIEDHLFNILKSVKKFKERPQRIPIGIKIYLNSWIVFLIVIKTY